MVTPLRENGGLDRPGLNNLIEHILAGGVHGIFLLGTTGEGPSLSHALRKQLVSEACAIVNMRVPVLVCITDTSLQESIELATHARSAGADALVVAPPYYLPISQAEMCDYLKCLAPLLPLPFLLYNMPSCTKLHLSLETVGLARKLGAIGIKDSSGDMEFLYSLIRQYKDGSNFSIITGTELFIPETITNGGQGAVAGGANFFPALFVQLYEATLTNDLEKISNLRKMVARIGETIYDVGKHRSKYIKSTKCVLSLMGICNDFMAPPLTPFNAVQRAEIKANLSEFTYDNEYYLAR